MGFLEPSLGFVWGEPIKVRQQKPVDEKYLDEAGPGPLQLINWNAGESVNFSFLIILIRKSRKLFHSKQFGKTWETRTQASRDGVAMS
jgi:hypothetical protein